MGIIPGLWQRGVPMPHLWRIALLSPFPPVQVLLAVLPTKRMIHTGRTSTGLVGFFGDNHARPRGSHWWLFQTDEVDDLLVPSGRIEPTYPRAKIDSKLMTIRITWHGLKSVENIGCKDVGMGMVKAATARDDEQDQLCA